MDKVIGTFLDVGAYQTILEGLKKAQEQKEKESIDVILPNHSFDIQPPQVNDLPFTDETENNNDIL